MRLDDQHSTYQLNTASHDEPVDQAADASLRAKAKTAAEKFEGNFISEMLHQMRRSTREMAGEDSIYKNRVNEDMLDLADGLVADTMASQHAFGIADVILRQLLPTTPDANAGVGKPSQTSMHNEHSTFKFSSLPVALD